MSSDPSLNIAARGNQFLYVNWTLGQLPPNYQYGAGTLFVTDTSIDIGSSASALYKISVVATDLSYTINSLTDASGQAFPLENGTEYMVVFMQTNVPVSSEYLYQGSQVKSSPPQLGVPANVPDAPTILNVVDYDEFSRLTVQYNYNGGDGLKLLEFVAYAPSINVCETYLFQLNLPIDTPIDATGEYDISGQAVTNYIQAEVSCYTYNEIGQSANLSNTVLTFPTDIPNKPTNVAIAAPLINKTVVVSWTAPNDAAPPGEHIDYYILDISGIDNSTRFDISLNSADLDVSFASVFDLSYTIPSNYFSESDLGKYFRARVAAVNIYGTSPYSDFSVTRAAPYDYPDPVTDLSAVYGDQQITISWVPPTYTGGFPLTTYDVKVNGVSQFAPASASSYVITNLTNGTLYNITINARNTGGTPVQGGGIAVSTGESTSATPSGRPYPPVLALDGFGFQEFTVSWTAPDNNGSPITYYNVYLDNVFDASTTDLTYTYTGLINGQLYNAKVAAVNVNGEGIMSNIVSVTPGAVPDAPVVNPLQVLDTALGVTWSAPNANGYTITSYNIYLDGSLNGTVNGSTLTYTITGLTNGVSYDVTVSAVNSNGEGPESIDVSAIPGKVPDAPVLDTLDVGDEELTASWTAPADNGYAITSYEVYVDGSLNASVDGTTVTYIIPNLVNGVEYAVTIVAVNARGPSASSNELSAIPGAVPNAPVLEPLVEGDLQLTATWTDPSNNGYEVLYYEVFIDNVIDQSVNAPDLSVVLTPLANGVSFSVKVRAVNDIGAGPFSQTQTGSPGTVPGAPTNLTGLQANQSVQLSWTAPADNGGRDIAGYHVYVLLGGVVDISYVRTGQDTEYLVPNLTNGLTYTFYVAAYNTQFGEGADSNNVNVIPAGTPAPPQGLNIGYVDISAVNFYFNNPTDICNNITNGSPIEYFQLYIEQDGVVTPLRQVTPEGPYNPQYEYINLIGGLNVGVSYRIGVATVVTINGLSVESEIIYTTHFSPTAYPVVEIYDISGDKVYVQVQVTGSALLNYTCLVPVLSGEQAGTYAIIEGDFAGVNFAPYIADPNSYYRFEIQYSVPLDAYASQPAFVNVANASGIGYATNAM